VPWTHDDSPRAGTVHVGDGDEIASAESSVVRGTMRERPFGLVGQQYL